MPIPNIFEALQVNLGTAYVNDFNAFGRVYQVRAQADQRFRVDQDDINRLRVRSSTGALVPLGTLVEMRDVTGPDLVQRYNMYHVGAAAGQRCAGRVVGHGARRDGGRSPRETLPPGHGLRMDRARLPGAADRQHRIFIFAPVGAVRLPGAGGAVRELVAAARDHPDRADGRAVGARSASCCAGMDNNILTQIGLVVLVGLAAKNAILIVEFAKQARGARARRRSRPSSRPAGCGCGRS